MPPLKVPGILHPKLVQVLFQRTRQQGYHFLLSTWLVDPCSPKQDPVLASVCDFVLPLFPWLRVNALSLYTPCQVHATHWKVWHWMGLLLVPRGFWAGILPVDCPVAGFILYVRMVTMALDLRKSAISQMACCPFWGPWMKCTTRNWRLIPKDTDHHSLDPAGTGSPWFS